MPICYKDEREKEWGADFGNNLQQVIKSRKITQQQLANKLGITNAMLSRYIHGLAVPSAYKACQIADIIGCDVNELIKMTYEE